MTTMASAVRAISVRADWRLVVAKHRSLRRRHPQVGEALAGGFEDVGPVVVAERGLGQEGDGPAGVGQGVDVGLGLDQVDRRRGHGHGAHRLVVALVADVDDGVALARPHLDLVVDLGDQGAHGVDHEPAPRARAAATTSGADPWALSMRGAPSGTSATSSTKTTPSRRKRSTTSWLWTISWKQYTGGSKTRTIQARALIAISTPAQNPRGAASSTRSTAIAQATGSTGAYRPHVPARILVAHVRARGRCRRARIAGRRGPASCPGDEIARHRRPGAPRRHRVAAAGRRGRPRARRAPGRPGHRAWPCPRRRAQPLGRRGVVGPVRPGADVRQPLRVLLHLPAAQGPAPQPVREGRRLPAVVPLRQLHHPHPLHRARPRTGGHRAAEPDQREHPRHRPRGPGPDAAQPAGRHQPALAAGPARRRHRGPRPGRGVPRRQRRGRPRRHPGRRPRPVPGAGHRLRGAPGREPVLHRGVDAAPHPRRGGGRRRHGGGLAGGVPRRPRPAGRLRRRRVLPAGRPPLPDARRLRGLPHARGRRGHGPGLRARAHRASPTTRPSACSPASSPGSTAPRPRATGPPARLRPAATRPRSPAAPRTGRPPAPPERARRRPHRRVRGPGARPAPRPGTTACGSSPSRTGSSAATSASPACWWGRTWPAPWPTSPRATATCCPTCACRTASSSTAPGPPTCPGRWRSSPPTASPCAGPWPPR